MQFKKEDENYIYGVVGQNVKKYRKEKGFTQAQLAEKINYSLAFVSGLESKKHQTFSLGALWRISLVLEIDIDKLFIDNNIPKDDKPKFIKYICHNCGYKTDIPYELIELLKKAHSLYKNESYNPSFKCANCDDLIYPND